MPTLKLTWRKLKAVRFGLIPNIIKDEQEKKIKENRQ